MELREWATRELRGYANDDDDLPDYRRAGAVIKVDAIRGNFRITGQQISPTQLPDVVQEHIREEVRLIVGVGEIEGMVAQARANNDWLTLSLPMGADILQLMNHKAQQPFQQITAVYWVISTSALVGVLDQIRTILAGLVAEMRAGMPDEEATPSAEVADQAVHVTVHGPRARVNVTTALASGSGAHNVRAEPSSPARDSKWKKIGGAIVGLATIGILVVAILQWRGWGF